MCSFYVTLNIYHFVLFFVLMYSITAAGVRIHHCDVLLHFQFFLNPIKKVNLQIKFAQNISFPFLPSNHKVTKWSYLITIEISFSIGV